MMLIPALVPKPVTRLGQQVAGQVGVLKVAEAGGLGLRLLTAPGEPTTAGGVGVIGWPRVEGLQPLNRRVA